MMRQKTKEKTSRNVRPVAATCLRRRRLQNLRRAIESIHMAKKNTARDALQVSQNSALMGKFKDFS
jgi:hypothetical protein